MRLILDILRYDWIIGSWGGPYPYNCQCRRDSCRDCDTAHSFCATSKVRMQQINYVKS